MPHWEDAPNLSKVPCVPGTRLWHEGPACAKCAPLNPWVAGPEYTLVPGRTGPGYTRGPGSQVYPVDIWLERRLLMRLRPQRPAARPCPMTPHETKGIPPRHVHQDPRQCPSWDVQNRRFSHGVRTVLATTYATCLRLHWSERHTLKRD